MRRWRLPCAANNSTTGRCCCWLLLPLLLLLLLQYFTGQKPYKDALAVEAPRLRSYGPLYDFMSEDPLRWMGAWLSRETDKNK